MPTDPNVLLAQPNAANGQADVKDAAAQRLGAEGDAAGDLNADLRFRRF